MKKLLKTEGSNNPLVSISGDFTHTEREVTEVKVRV